MTRTFRAGYLPLIVFGCSILFGGCVDNNIEGAENGAIYVFSVDDVAISPVGLNDCPFGSGNNGTQFRATINYKGAPGDYIDYVVYQYEGATETSVAYADHFNDSNSSGDYEPIRSTSPSRNYQVTLNIECWRWGAATSSIEYTFEVYTIYGRYGLIKGTLSKPNGAN